MTKEQRALQICETVTEVRAHFQTHYEDMVGDRTALEANIASLSNELSRLIAQGLDEGDLRVRNLALQLSDTRKRFDRKYKTATEHYEVLISLLNSYVNVIEELIDEGNYPAVLHSISVRKATRLRKVSTAANADDIIVIIKRVKKIIDKLHKGMGVIRIDLENIHTEEVREQAIAAQMRAQSAAHHQDPVLAEIQRAKGQAAQIPEVPVPAPAQTEAPAPKPNQN